MLAVPLDGGGAVLGALEPWQAEEFLAHMDRGREFIGGYIGFPDAVTDVDSARRVLEDYAGKAAADTGRIYGIRDGGTLVGGVLFRTMDAGQGVAEAGCWLEPAATGRGLVTRAVRVIIDWVFRERGFHRVEWRCASGNRASIAVAERLGMTRDGVLRQSHLLRGHRQDIEVWSVLAPEWEERRGG
ncbi:GNAT family protein [Nocardiopsis sp. RSe5-2]|uniref:GNAT family protein n=1 Tax=Nocardiopsis endophytica TaxID=3018445 RepID=A0ABT4TYL2_9ACTN|nr:GNAT family protein [Nocardiopsis endophytica]MDA2809793.1 GNAT family protein [Nocardiopsis endophytica]